VAHYNINCIISWRAYILLTEMRLGSKVTMEMRIRCKSFLTVNEPGGLKYFCTKEGTDFSSQIRPGLEEAMMRMQKNGLRRIKVSATMVFAVKADLLPLPTTKSGKRSFQNLLKTMRNSCLRCW
jgi:hypothetical protein